MFWSLWMHLFQYCMKDWKELWVDTAFWHIFFCTILVVIMFLWRPSQNNQRYAFTPLLDNSEDENEEDIEEDELFTKSGGQRPAVYEVVSKRDKKQENGQSNGSVAGKDGENKNSKLEDDLQWIENNIPTTLAEALVDEEEDKAQRELEISKML
nr:unnamed protein product [Meloidogyne enterolobii]